MRDVDSKNKVSVGGILWKTTELMEDLPLLIQPICLVFNV